ncbi:MAG: hypothetical protein AAGF12_16110 [Myxococcota bacterium]
MSKLREAHFVALACLALCACGDDNSSGSDPSGDDASIGDSATVGADGSSDAVTVDAPPPEFSFTAVTFNTGTTDGLGHDDPPDDGYTSTDAETSDQYYGNGLAWNPAIDATRTFFAELRPEVVVFQEIFGGDCGVVPPEGRSGFVCENAEAMDVSVAERVLGADYQIACHLGKPDKCAAVRRDFGSFRGCGEAHCLEGLAGAPIDGCGSGSRIGRGVIDLTDGGSITVVNIHGTSGFEADEQACRVAQFEQVFVDLDGSPAANGNANLVLGDLNTDPARLRDGDPSALRFTDFVGEGKAFQFISDGSPIADPTYAGLLNIDHVVSDAFRGSCRTGEVTDAVYFDHVPIVCAVGGDRPR